MCVFVHAIVPLNRVLNIILLDDVTTNNTVLVHI